MYISSSEALLLDVRTYQQPQAVQAVPPQVLRLLSCVPHKNILLIQSRLVVDSVAACSSIDRHHVAVSMAVVVDGPNGLFGLAGRRLWVATL